jgi:hypothetical protein
MQKQKFSVKFPGSLFMEIAPGPTVDEKYCVNVSLTGHSGMHYVTHRSHWVQKHKFDVTRPNLLLCNPYLSHLSMKNSVSCFMARMQWNALHDLHIPRMQNYKLEVMCRGTLFMKTTLGPPQA